MSESSLSRAPMSAEPETVTEFGFSDDFKITWYRSPIEPALLAELMQRDDLRMAANVGPPRLFLPDGHARVFRFSKYSSNQLVLVDPTVVAYVFRPRNDGAVYGTDCRPRINAPHRL